MRASRNLRGGEVRGSVPHDVVHGGESAACGGETADDVRVLHGESDGAGLLLREGAVEDAMDVAFLVHGEDIVQGRLGRREDLHLASQARVRLEREAGRLVLVHRETVPLGKLHLCPVRVVHAKRGHGRGGRRDGGFVLRVVPAARGGCRGREGARSHVATRAVTRHQRAPGERRSARSPRRGHN